MGTMGPSQLISILCFFLSFGSISSSVSSQSKTPSWPGPYWDIPGQFCSSRYPKSGCCLDRNDECSVPILGTTCYCDQFCNRTESDCCPDYFTHCQGIKQWNPLFSHGAKPEEIKRPEYCSHGVMDARKPVCLINGKEYNTREKIQMNCNMCKCQASVRDPGCMELMCDNDRCLIEKEVLRELEAGGEALYSWKPSNYSFLWGRTLQEGINMKLGAIRPDYPVNHMAALEFRYKESDLPDTFDSRQRWPSLLSGIQDQGWCSSSWAMSTASVASDRLSLSTGRRVSLSPQSLVSCDTRGQAGCKGGHLDQAWNFLRKYGVLPMECFPYTSEAGEIAGCTVPRRRKVDLSSLNCSSLDGRSGLYKTQPAYRVGRHNTNTHPRRREQDIMFEILKNGPVQGLMEVWTDLFMYGSGVYSRTNLASPSVAGHHAVKIVGWGETMHKGKPLPYWIVANSWGNKWGEEGYFKIKRGSNECMIEEFVIGVWARQDRRSRNRHRRRHSRGDPGRFFRERSQPDRKTRYSRHNKRN